MINATEELLVATERLLPDDDEGECYFLKVPFLQDLDAQKATPLAFAVHEKPFLWGGIQQTLRETRRENYPCRFMRLWIFLTMTQAPFVSVSFYRLFSRDHLKGGTLEIVAIVVLSILLSIAIFLVVGACIYHLLGYTKELETMHRRLETKFERFSDTYSYCGWEITYTRPVPAKTMWHNRKALLSIKRCILNDGNYTDIQPVTRDCLFARDDDNEDEDDENDDEYRFYLSRLAVRPWDRPSPLDVCTYGAILETWLPLERRFNKPFVGLTNFAFLLLVCILSPFLDELQYFLALFGTLTVLFVCNDLYQSCILWPKAASALDGIREGVVERCGYLAAVRMQCCNRSVLTLSKVASSLPPPPV